MTEAQPQRTSGGLLWTRLAIGLLQGLTLYLLHEAREALPNVLFRALALTALFAPIVALGALGAVRRRTLAGWLAIAALALLGLGAYDAYVFHGSSWPRDDVWPRPALFAFSAAMLFVAHHLVVPADAERRWVASYGRYFDEGWKDGVRLALGAAFVGGLWLLLFLGAALFKLIGLGFLEDLIEKPWFAWPATTTFFAIAIHVTDARAGLVLGARTLALNLLAWLLPLMTLIAAGFLVALAFTGLEPLWRTGRAGGILLAATAALVVLTNATYQEGERKGHPPAALKWAVRIAGVLLAPLVLVAAYGVALRVGQYGLTPQRIYALACLVVALAYAGGYAWAAVGRGPWMRRLERVNVVAAHLVVLVVLAVFSPLADPVRLSVGDQVARLASGKVRPDTFDYAFLRFHGGRWGRAALDDLKADPRPVVRERVAKVQAMRSPYETEPTSLEARRKAFEGLGAPLPTSFVEQQKWREFEDPARSCAPSCPALVRDLDADGANEVIVFEPHGPSPVYGFREGVWLRTGALSHGLCPGDLEALKAGRFSVRPARGSVVEVGGRVYGFEPKVVCPGDKRDGEVVDVTVVRPAK